MAVLTGKENHVRIRLDVLKFSEHRRETMGKYLFFDIDGTLAGKSRRITSKTRWAVQRAREKGHQGFVCTGRVPAAIVGELTYM